MPVKAFRSPRMPRIDDAIAIDIRLGVECVLKERLGVGPDRLDEIERAWVVDHKESVPLETIPRLLSQGAFDLISDRHGGQPTALDAATFRQLIW